MPDHVHLLLLVDYDQDPAFNPLVFLQWIKTMAQGLPPRYDPSLEDSRFLAEHRALLLSALPIGAPFDWNACHTMNALAEDMGQRARER